MFVTLDFYYLGNSDTGAGLRITHPLHIRLEICNNILQPIIRLSTVMSFLLAARIISGAGFLSRT